MEEIPQLNIARAAPEDLVPALKLISNTVAQQRQVLNYRIITHPYFLLPSFTIVGIITAINLRNKQDYFYEVPTLAILLAGVLIALFSCVSRYTSDYLNEAEKIGSEEGLQKYLEGPDREVIVARWGGVVIGVVALRFPSVEKAEIWAWSVQIRYRDTGLGRDLLEKAVKVARRRNGADCEIGFAKDHARMDGRSKLRERLLTGLQTRRGSPMWRRSMCRLRGARRARSGLWRRLWGSE